MGLLSSQRVRTLGGSPALGTEVTFPKAPGGFAPAGFIPTVRSSATPAACASGRARWGGLVALKFGVLGEGSWGALPGEQVGRLGVLWGLGEPCGSCLC